MIRLNFSFQTSDLGETLTFIIISTHSPAMSCHTVGKHPFDGYSPEVKPSLKLEEESGSSMCWYFYHKL